MIWEGRTAFLGVSLPRSLGSIPIRRTRDLSDGSRKHPELLCVSKRAIKPGSIGRGCELVRLAQHQEDQNSTDGSKLYDLCRFRGEFIQIAKKRHRRATLESLRFRRSAEENSELASARGHTAAVLRGRSEGQARIFTVQSQCALANRARLRSAAAE
jgi:hypothetical protein